MLISDKLKLTEQKLEDAIRSQEAIFAAIPDLMFELSLDGRYLNIWANNPQELAATKQELLGYTVFEKLPQGAAQEVKNAINEANDYGTSFGRHIHINTPNGHLWFELSVSLKNNAPSPQTFIILSRNISKRKELEIALLHFSNYDALTNLLNRRVLEEKLIQDIKRAQRNKQPLSICMLDIDYFKTINDSYGHHVGDEVLKKISKLIATTIRDVDYCGRYGGEEFVIVLPKTPISIAQDIAERIRNTIHNKVFISDNEKKFTTSASIGIAEFNKKNDSLEHIIKAADIAMYSAKKSGRNRIVSSLY